MKPEEQRIKIAEACGWRCIQQSDYAPFGESYFVGLNPNGEENFQKVPDYLNDLNAMHDVLQTLDKDQTLTYMQNLCIIIVCITYKNAWWDLEPQEAFFVSQATAAQRAEAFLKTLNLWIAD